MIIQRSFLLRSLKINFRNFDIIYLLNILLVLISSFIFFYLFKGKYTDINPDFDFYLEPFLRMQESGCQGLTCLSEFVPKVGPDGFLLWVPSPFYSTLFLLPITLFSSNILFLIQGLIITFLNLSFFKKVLKLLFKEKFTDKYINLILLIGTLNYPFLKDCLASGPTSVALLFTSIAICNYKKPMWMLLFLSFACFTRANYIFVLISYLIAYLICRNKIYHINFIIPLIAVFVYIFYFKINYYSYPGNTLLNSLFKPGIHGMQIIEDYFVQRLPVNTFNEIFYLKISLIQLINIFVKDLSILYGVFVLSIIKFLSMLGFENLFLFMDNRGIYFQRLLVLINFIFIMAPSFFIILFSLITNQFSGYKILNKNEKLVLTTTLIFTFLHAFVLGQPRYLIGFHFIYVSALISFLAFIKFPPLNTKLLT